MPNFCCQLNGHTPSKADQPSVSEAPDLRLPNLLNQSITPDAVCYSSGPLYVYTLTQGYVHNTATP
jgi:hypothetical protein